MAALVKNVVSMNFAGCLIMPPEGQSNTLNRGAIPRIGAVEGRPSPWATIVRSLRDGFAAILIISLLDFMQGRWVSVRSGFRERCLPSGAKAPPVDWPSCGTAKA